MKKLVYTIFYIGLIVILLTPSAVSAQLTVATKPYTQADTLRGSDNAERNWWDVQRYEIELSPDFDNKSLKGANEIKYLVKKAHHGNLRMQIDLKNPLQIDSVLYNGNQRVKFEKQGSVWYVTVPQQVQGAENKIKIYYQGKVHEAIRPPWDGGFIFAIDSLNRPYMSVACQGLGASVWFPNKDHQSDEPNRGASLTMTVPDSLVAIGNGRLVYKKEHGNGTTTYQYNVNSPINNYCIIPYIGKYVNFKETYMGEKGPLSVNYWVLDYNLPKAKNYMPDQVHKMFKAFEHWFGPYPFYEDGFQLIDAPHTGMGHQSAVSYGNQYKFGYRGRDASGSGYGMKFDFIIIHESGHEWFGNNITTNDLADMWVHEGFTNYSETLFVDYHFGEAAGNAYNYGIRRGIQNDKPIIPDYGVNAQGSGDMYPKGGNLIHSIRHSLGDDALFRKILRGLNTDYYHQTVNSSDVEAYISKHAGFNYQPVFDQYLRTTQIPTLVLKLTGNKLQYYYQNCVPNFNLPIVLGTAENSLKLWPTSQVQEIQLKPNQVPLIDASFIEKLYYLHVNIQ